MLEFNNKIEYCPNCKKSNFSDFDTFNHFGYNLNYVICEECTLIFMQPQMTIDETNNFYKNSYRKIYQNSEKPTKELLQVQENRGKFLADFFARNSSFDKHHHFNYLDIGCSTGMHLQAIKNIFPNANLYGIEPGDEFRLFCKEKDLNVFESLEEFYLQDIKIDAVCLSHVLEHISDPVNFLKQINHIQNTNGILLIEVPNTLGGHISFELAHPTCFYTNTLIETCRLAGFEKLNILEHSNTAKYKVPMYLTGIFKKSNIQLPAHTHLMVEEVKSIRRKILQKLDRKKRFLRLKKKFLG